MAYELFPTLRRGRGKPTRGARINWGHPLARNLVGGLLFTGGGEGAFELVNRLVLARMGTPRWIGGPLGLGLVADTGNAGAAFPAAPELLRPATQVTLLWHGVVLGDQTGTNNPCLAALYHNNSSDAPFLSYGICRRSSNQTALFFLWNNNGTAANVAPASIIDYGQPVQYALSIGGLNGPNAVAYRNGHRLTSGAFTSPITYGATAELRVGNHITVTTEFSHTQTGTVYIWNRALSQSEIAELAETPYAFIWPEAPPLVSYFVVTATNLFTYVPSGGITFGGAATTEGPAGQFTYEPSGGLAFGGVASTSVTHAFSYAPTGGLAFGGDAETSVSRVYEYAPSGGVSFAGDAEVRLLVELLIGHERTLTTPLAEPFSHSRFLLGRPLIADIIMHRRTLHETLPRLAHTRLILPARMGEAFDAEIQQPVDAAEVT